MISKPSALLLFYASCLLFFVSHSAAQQPTAELGEIRGVVMDEGGSPVSEAEVDRDSISHGPVGKAISLALTDKSGAFTFSPVKFGSYKLYALKPESGYPDTKFDLYSESYHPVTATVSAASPIVSVVIVVGPRAGMVKLTVIDKVTRQPIPSPTTTIRRLDTDAWISVGRTEDMTMCVPPSIPTEITVHAEGYKEWPNHGSSGSAAKRYVNIASGKEVKMVAELERDQ